MKSVAVALAAPPPPPIAVSEVCMLVLPLSTYKSLSDAAQARNISVSEFLSRAIDSYVMENK